MSASENRPAVPIDAETERALVSSAFQDPTGVGLRIADRVAPEHLADPSCRAVLAALGEMRVLRAPVDYTSLCLHLGERRLEAIGGHAYLSDLVTLVPSPRNWRWYVERVEAAHLRRQIASAGARLQHIASDQDADHVAEARALLAGILRSGAGSSRYCTLQDGMIRAIDAMEDAATQREAGRLPGVPTGVVGLDEITGGWRAGDLIVVGARPSVGKTAMLLTFAVRAITSGVRAGFFTLEMGVAQLVTRIIASRSLVSLGRMFHGDFDDAEMGRVMAAVAGLQDAGMWIDDRSALTVEQVAARAMHWREVHGVGILLVDYLGLMRAPGRRADQSRVLEVAEISHGLKALAKELGIPVVVAAQLNREIERRGSGRPQLSDLRESGDIEQDADVVVLLHSHRERDDQGVYGVTAHVAKHRNGATGPVHMAFDAARSLYSADEDGLCRRSEEDGQQRRGRR